MDLGKFQNDDPFQKSIMLKRGEYSNMYNCPQKGCGCAQNVKAIIVHFIAVSDWRKKRMPLDKKICSSQHGDSVSTMEKINVYYTTMPISG